MQNIFTQHKKNVTLLCLKSLVGCLQHGMHVWHLGGCGLFGIEDFLHTNN